MIPNIKCKQVSYLSLQTDEPTLKAPVLKPEPKNESGTSEEKEEEMDEKKEEEPTSTVSPSLINLTTNDIYFNIDWKCPTQDIFLNEYGYYDIASVLNVRHNCHVFKTPCDEIVSLNITDCPGSKPFNSSCKFILNYYRDTTKCDNIPVLVTDFTCESFGKNHDLGAIDVICRKFEKETLDIQDSNSNSLIYNNYSKISLFITFLTFSFFFYF